MVKELISDGSGNAVELEGEGEGDTLEVSVCVLYTCDTCLSCSLCVFARTLWVC